MQIALAARATDLARLCVFLALSVLLFIRFLISIAHVSIRSVLLGDDS